MGGKPAAAGHIDKVGPKTVANEPYLDGRENLHTKRNDAKSGHFWLFWNVTRFGREMQRADTSFSSGPAGYSDRHSLQESAL